MKALTIRQPWGWAVLAGGADLLTVTEREYNALTADGTLPEVLALRAADELATPDDHVRIQMLTGDMPVTGAPGLVAADADGFIGLVYPRAAHHSDACLRACTPWGWRPGWHLELAPKRRTLARKVVPTVTGRVQDLPDALTIAILQETLR